MRMDSRIWYLTKMLFATAMATATLFSASCGGGGGGSGGSDYGDGSATSTVQLMACPASGSTDVIIRDFAFSPAIITVSANSIVKWTNTGESTHTVTSTATPVNGAFNSSSMTTGSSACFNFTTAGTYSYHCAIHTFMTGTVSVQ